MNAGTSYKDREGIEWVDGFGGLYVGRAPDGVVRIAITNGLPPWDPKADLRQGNTLQPEHFAKLAEFAIGRPTLVGPKVVALTDTAAALALSAVLNFFRPGGIPLSKDQFQALEAIPPMLTELAWAKDVIASRTGYVGTLSREAACPLDEWLLAAASRLRGLDKPRG